MSNAGNTSPGHIDRLTGTTELKGPDFGKALQTIREVEMEEALAILEQTKDIFIDIHAEIQRRCEQLVELIHAERMFGHRHGTRAAKLLEVMDECQKSYETIAAEYLK